jgi:hypothetical protein
LQALTGFLHPASHAGQQPVERGGRNRLPAYFFDKAAVSGLTLYTEAVHLQYHGSLPVIHGVFSSGKSHF